MKFEKINNKGQAQLFSNPYLEVLTKGHPAVIWGIYIPLLTYIVYIGYSDYKLSAQLLLLLFFSGMLFWTFFEYMAHRYVFHLISNKASLRRFAYIMHGNHHHYPRDKQRLFMPPVPSVFLAAMLFGLHWLILREYTFGFYPGFIIGYLLYASMHYAIHAYSPPFKFMKPLWKNHYLHHYKDEEKGFGVSNTIWDRIFGTMFDLNQEKVDSEKVKELMFKNKKPN